MHLLQPVLISALQAIASILVFEGPPSGHARKLSSTKPIDLAVRCDRGEEIEEIEDDLGTRLVLHT